MAAANRGVQSLVPLDVSGPKGTQRVYVLLDQACTFTALEEDVAKAIGLEGTVSPLEFSVFGEKVRYFNQSKTVSPTVKGVQRSLKSHDLQNVRTVPTLGIPASPLNIDELKMKWTYLEPVRAKNIPNVRPKMIIGNDYYHLFRPQNWFEDPAEEGPSGYFSKLGWYMAGFHGEGSCFFASCPKPEVGTDEDLHNLIKDFINTEDSGVKTSASPVRNREDQRAIDLLRNETMKVGEHFQTCLLWREETPQLPQSYKMAVHRLHLMEKKMDKNPEFARLCCEKIEDYVSKGYLIKAEKFKAELEPSNFKFYLPWFFAYHPTKKPRLVFDAAAKSEGKSLNDFLLKGPDLLNSLPDVLSKFRTYPIAITADIKEMFHQVYLDQKHWPAQTVLYRGVNRSNPPNEYYMTRLFFGSASSPCSAIYAKNLNAENYQDKYPAAVSMIKNNFYMDDLLGGANSDEEAIVLHQQITKIHSSGGFEICKWNTSSTNVLREIPNHLKTDGAINFQLKDDASLEKTLGLYWNPKEDIFQFKLNFSKIPEAVLSGTRNPTKREVTSFVMALFDPLGFLTPIKIQALIIIQDIWRTCQGWDERISDSITNKWKEWLKNLEEVKNVKIQRRLTTFSREATVSLHTFVDASEKAYSCAIYLLFEETGHRQLSLVCGKSRVAPLKGLTIPRMELNAALIGARLTKSVKNCFMSSFEIASSTYWSDSKTVLCWLRSENGNFKIYVQNRIAEILETTQPSEWKWVPTKENVADDATRSSCEEPFSSSCRWLTGVPFLLENEDKWPTEENLNLQPKREDLEVRESSFAISVPETTLDLPDISKFSSWFRLIRATATIILAKRKFKKENPTHLSVTDMEFAEKMWIRQSQQDSFYEEIFNLKNNIKLSTGSRLATLTPYLDEQSLLRYAGRIDAAPGVSEEVKRPVILDPAHPSTKLWIQWIHEEIAKHHGQEFVMSELRKKAWVLNCKSAVRSSWANCQKCKLRRLQPTTPIMGPLPKCRLGEGQRPFYNTGVDFFGPLQVKMNRRIVKRWGVMFCCMTTGAVHLELAEGLDTGEFMNCLTRFICFRCRPTNMWSDNGKNFVGAAKEIKDELKKWNENEVCEKLSGQIDWHFQPPATPHFGGLWERLIGNAKKIMCSMLKERAPPESFMRTLLCQVMDIMNSRPISYSSTDPDDSEVLTPNHILKTGIKEGPPILGCFTNGDRFRKKWKYCQYLATEFWRRWTDECLPLMIKRRIWTEQTEPLKVGDVVFLKDDLVPRSLWKKGIVIKCYPGEDNQVRVVDVRIALAKQRGGPPTIKTYRRSAVKVIPIGESVVLPSTRGGENVSASLNVNL